MMEHIHDFRIQRFYVRIRSLTVLDEENEGFGYIVKRQIQLLIPRFDPCDVPDRFLYHLVGLPFKGVSYFSNRHFGYASVI